MRKKEKIPIFNQTITGLEEIKEKRRANRRRERRKRKKKKKNTTSTSHKRENAHKGE